MAGYPEGDTSLHLPAYFSMDGSGSAYRRSFYLVARPTKNKTRRPTVGAVATRPAPRRKCGPADLIGWFCHYIGQCKRGGRRATGKYQDRQARQWAAGL